MPFKLAEGLFYNNAWENAASAMEMSAIAGKNSALLVQQYLETRLGGKFSKPATAEA
jgi:prenylcysteine oxidase / farnesylcysteine lyase